ncbi:FmdB family zinc ribbon protein [Kocuria marina]|uniref:Putative regulatory protein, FmdB family n=1 Tax=Kocuria marina subsp. indica TaxID=1049583 RepID=A0A1X7D5J4_9MICC|nr:zinc ribbon domain-containing protein [Kocuria indica]OXS83104.1 hypothetical protein B1B07_06890 [Kocuria indica]RLP57952.1 zinc ribbon domain-containing protein [Kocuria indica]SMF08934.1 putative regulatory protein, FmdB family [Kocuria indica]
MPVYEFRCEACGPFDAHHAMAQVPRSQDCPVCGANARRVFSAVGLSRANSARARVIDDAARTADAPDVVRSLPRQPGAAPAVTRDPRHAKLPRP